jgi:hypothetical protein
MGTWNNLVGKFEALLSKINLKSTVEIGGREIPPLVMGFALITICIPIWGYLEFEGQNKLVGALVVVLMAWGVAQLGALGFGDGVGEKPSGSTTDKPRAIQAAATSSQNPTYCKATQAPTQANMLDNIPVHHKSQTPESTERYSLIKQPETISGTPPDQQKLARLAFAGVILALAVIYVVRNVDRYEDVNMEFRFGELTAMVEPFKDTIEMAILSTSEISLDSFNSGVAELPDEVLASVETHGISVMDGQIIGTWKKDGSDLDGVSYIVTPKIERGEVKWSITGTCSEKKAC